MKETIETIQGLSASDKLRYKLEAEEDAKRIYKTEIYDAKQEGEALGIQAGRTQGIEEGRILGIEEGRALGIEEGEALGIEKGKTLGKVEGALEIARKMKKSGLDTTFIIEMTGLTEKEINNIK